MSDFKGIIRGVDHLGRIVIPKEIRKQLDIEDGKDSLQMQLTETGELILKKHKPTCIFCGCDAPAVTFNGSLICRGCLNELTSIE